MAHRQPFFSIIVPTYNRPQQLAACLQSLYRMDYPRDRYEVIVVDDGGPASTGNESALFRDGFDLTLVTQSHAGPGAARNTGAARARGDFLAFTGDDCTPASDWLQALAARCAKAPNCAHGGKIANALTHNAYSVATHLLVDYMYSYYNADPDRARFFTPNNLVLPTQFFHQVGGFDPSFVSGAGEDRDFCDRWLRRGYCMVYAPEVVVYHAHALTLRTFWRLHCNYGRGSRRYRVKCAQRKGTDMELEPLRFYINLLRYPFSRPRLRKKLRLVGLLGVAQAANAAGFFRRPIEGRARYVERGESLRW